MPGPKHGTPRRPGARPDPNGNPRVPNRKAAKRLEARKNAFQPAMPDSRLKCHMPGSQNRNK